MKMINFNDVQDEEEVGREQNLEEHHEKRIHKDDLVWKTGLLFLLC